LVKVDGTSHLLFWFDAHLEKASRLCLVSKFEVLMYKVEHDCIPSSRHVQFLLL
jgi:hypothetical protein